MKDKLVSALGTFGVVLWYAIVVLITFAPLTILGFSFWIDAIIIFAITTIPFLGSIVNVVIWIWAFVVCIGGPQDVFAIIYYVLFANKAIYVLLTMASNFRRQ